VKVYDVKCDDGVRRLVFEIRGAVVVFEPGAAWAEWGASVANVVRRYFARYPQWLKERGAQ
jgi:hypothetical protein